jgi:hypothetical protein
LEVSDLLLLLKSQYAKRKFYFASLAALVLLIVASVLLSLIEHHLPSWVFDAVHLLLSEATAAVLFSIIVVSFFLWITPRAMARAEIASVSPHEIREALTASFRGTTEYWFRGRSGRFLRSKVLPAISASASEELRAKTVYILVPDPRATEPLEEYARTRNSLGIPNDGGPWTAARIRNEIMSTILGAAKLSVENSLINIQIGLLPAFGTLRFDITTNAAVITREDPRWPALRCDSQSVFYNMFREELRTSLEQSTRIAIDNRALHGLVLSADTLCQYMKAVGIECGELTAEDRAKIIDGVNQPFDPYATTSR